MISHLGTGLAEVEAQVAALGDAGVVQTEQLGVSVSQLKEALNSISQPLSDSDTGTSRLIERIGQMRTMLGEVNEIANGSLPQNLVAANDVAAQTRAALADAQAEIAEVDARLMQLRSAADAMRDGRSEEHTSELQSLMRISYAVFCLKKKTTSTQTKPHTKHNTTKTHQQ